MERVPDDVPVAVVRRGLSMYVVESYTDTDVLIAITTMGALRRRGFVIPGDSPLEAAPRVSWWRTLQRRLTGGTK